MNYIDIEKNLIPYRFDISISNEVFTFEVHYNADYDFFTIDLSKGSEVLVLGEKLIYGTPLFQDIRDIRYPKLTITPFDVSGNSESVIWETLSVNVFLYLGGEENA